MTRSLRGLTLIALFCAAPAALGSGVLVSPSAYANTAAPVNNVVPLSWGLFGLPATGRVQQAYPASDFSVGPAIQITGIAFRPDEGDSTSFGSSSGTIQSVEIHLSTTPKAPGALDTTFANNVGADDTIVYSGPVTMTYDPTGQTVGVVRPFQWTITFSTPFTYQPANGNLLVDFKTLNGVNPGLGTIPTADADGLSSSVCRVATSSSTGTVSDPSGTTICIGVVTQFAYGTTPVELSGFRAE